MSVVVVIEDRAGQHADLVRTYGDRPAMPTCRCGGQSFRGSDLCMKCGRHVRGLRIPVLELGMDFPMWDTFMRERPHHTGRRMLVA